MRIAVLSAMAEELALYEETCRLAGTTEQAGLTLQAAHFEGHDLVLVKTGVGKVNAALATQLVIDRMGPDAVICTGTAGALHDGLSVGDLLVGEDCLQHDLRVEFLGLSPGHIPFTDLREFTSAPSLVQRARAVDLRGHTIHTGRILTGDTFVQDDAARRALHDELGGDCVEMEGAAVGQVCTLNDVPFLVVRALLDRADGSSDIDFQAFLHEAARSSARLVLQLLTELSADGLT
jgi:adenosylhomocysteine nucleosidase